MNLYRFGKYLLYAFVVIYSIFWVFFIFFKDSFLKFVEMFPHNLAIPFVLSMAFMAPIIIIVVFTRLFFWLRDYTSKVVEPHIKMLISNENYKISFVSGLFVGLIFLGVTFLMDLTEYILYSMSLHQFRFIKYLAGFIILIYLLGAMNKTLEIDSEV